MKRDEVTIQEASEILGVSREKVRRMIQAGQLHARQSVLDQRQKLIARREIDAILEAEQKARRDLTEQAAPR